MFSKGKFYMIGFHGCDQETRNKIVLHQDTFKESVNEYDWLGHGKDHLLRNLDCAVINTLCEHYTFWFRHKYDSVRGAFWEGDELYPGAAIKEKSHIQICVRNIECIKAVFIP